MTDSIVLVIFWLFIIIYPIYFFGRGPIRSFQMRRLAKKMNLNFKVRESLLSISNKFFKNYISGSYRGKQILIYDIYNYGRYSGSSSTTILIDNVIIYDDAGEIKILKTSTKKLFKIVNEYITNGFYQKKGMKKFIIGSAVLGLLILIILMMFILLIINFVR